MVEIDIDTRNDRFQLLESFRANRHKRTRYGVVFVEGVAMINALFDGSTRIRSIVVPKDRKLSDWALDVIATGGAEELLRVRSDLYAHLSDKQDPTEMIVVADRPLHTLDALPLDRLDLVAVLDRPASPGNLGTCVRSCNAFAVQAVVVLGHSADVWDPRSLRASLGAVFTTPVIQLDSPRILKEWINRWRRTNPSLRVFGTDSSGTTTIIEAHVRCPAVVMFGNEATGLSANLRDYVDDVVAIPMYGTVNSINLASALTVALYEIRTKAPPESAGHP